VFLAKLVLRMHKNCYFRAITQNTDPAVEFPTARIFWRWAFTVWL